MCYSNFRCILECQQGDVSESTKAILQSMAANLPSQDSLYIAATNDAVDIFNIGKLHQHNGPLWTAKSIDNGSRRSLSSLRNCQQLLQLKVGAPVMITMNLSECVNGSRGVVRHLDSLRQFVIVEIGDKTVTLNRHVFTLHFHGQTSTREQFPLKLAWALTVHRCQGQTLPRVQIDCTGFFVANQLSVAISRVRNISDISLLNFTLDAVKPMDAEVKEYLESGKFEKVRLY